MDPPPIMYSKVWQNDEGPQKMEWPALPGDSRDDSEGKGGEGMHGLGFKRWIRALDRKKEARTCRSDQ